MSITRYQQSHNQGVSRDFLIYGGSGNESASKIIHNVGRIQLHAAVGLMSLFPCCSMRDGGSFSASRDFPYSLVLHPDLPSSKVKVKSSHVQHLSFCITPLLLPLLPHLSNTSAFLLSLLFFSFLLTYRKLYNYAV